MKRWIAYFLVLIVSSDYGQAQDVTVSNAHVGATVETLTGRVTIRQSPGSPISPQLSYPEKSFVAILWGDKILTNNNVGVNLSGDTRRENLSSAVNHHSGDTVRTVWDLQKRRIVQTVYPVDLSSHGQIVIRWTVENKDSVASVLSAAQFLLDLQIHKQDTSSREILTRYGSNRIWEKFTTNPAAYRLGLPKFYTTFSKMPRLPLPDTFLTATGYTTDGNYKLGLKKPKVMTIGDWALPFSSSLVDNLWGVSPTAPWISNYSDAGILFEWDSIVVPPQATREVGSMSYGTGSVHLCESNSTVTGLMYPEYIVNRSGILDPLQFEVNAFVFDQQLSGATTMSMSLHVGPNLRIVSPDTGRTGEHLQRQRMEPTGGFIPDIGTTTAAWMLVAEMPHCNGDILSWLKVTTNGIDTCTYPIKIDCNNPTKTVAIVTLKDVFELIGNPASDRTMLRLFISRAIAGARVDVFDITGRSVASHNLGELHAGLNEIAFSTADLHPGVYYVTVSYGSRRETRKLIVR